MTPEPAAPLGRRIKLARELVTEHAILTGDQRAQIVDALEDAEREIARLARVTPDNPHGYRREFPTPADAGHAEFAAEVRRLAAQSEQRARNHLAEQLDKTRAERDLLTRERDQARAERDRVRAERDQYRNGAHNMAAAIARFVDRNKALTEQLAQRDTEITKRWKRNRELNGDVAVAQDARAKAEHERDRLRARNEEIEADRVEQLRTLESMRAERDKAAHNMRRERARADRYCRDAEAAEGRLEQIAGILNRTPFPPDRTDPEPGDSWVDHVHERQELAAQLRATPGRTLRVTNPWGPGGTVHQVAAQDDRAGWVPVDGPAGRPGPHQGPTLEQLRDQVDGLIAERTPGPRPGPTPATPSAIGHSPSLHMLGACPCQAGTPFDPDYTEADLDPATAADEETPV